MDSAYFEWVDKRTCDDYANTWEISCDEVHYGWLSPGENALGLLEDVPKGSNVLDVGCGMGENMVALDVMDLVPYGIDISEHMLKRARKNLQSHKVMKRGVETNRRLRNCDVRNMRSQFTEKFRAIVSAYSLEFLPSIGAFENAVSIIADALSPGGTFVCSIAHPTTHPEYPNITNETISMSDKVSLLLYSIRDVVKAICDSGMVIERVVEQQTHNPSQMTYEDAQRFPYHFRKGKNPFYSLFDEYSNKSPHTLVYKARRQI